MYLNMPDPASMNHQELLDWLECTGIERGQYALLVTECLKRLMKGSCGFRIEDKEENPKK